jgi:hypothetical protein
MEKSNDNVFASVHGRSFFMFRLVRERRWKGNLNKLLRDRETCRKKGNGKSVYAH